MVIQSLKTKFGIAKLAIRNVNNLENNKMDNLINGYYVSADGTAFNSETSPLVRVIVDRLRENKERVKIFYGDIETGKLWDDKPDIGHIGRSTGKIKIPLVVYNARSKGGTALIDNKIIRIEYANKKDSKKSGVRFLFDSGMLQ